MKSRRVKRSKRSKSKRKKMKRRSYSRTRVSLSKRKRSKPKKQQEIFPNEIILDKNNVYDSYTPRNELFIDLPHSTRVYPSHPLLQHNGEIYYFPKGHYGHEQGVHYVIQRKNKIAVYSNHLSNGDYTYIDDDHFLLHKSLETSYQYVLPSYNINDKWYSDRYSSVLIQVNDNTVYQVNHMSHRPEPFLLSEFTHNKKESLTHYFGDAWNGYLDNILYVTSDHLFYIGSCYGVNRNKYDLFYNLYSEPGYKIVILGPSSLNTLGIDLSFKDKIEILLRSSPEEMSRILENELKILTN